MCILSNIMDIIVIEEIQIFIILFFFSFLVSLSKYVIAYGICHIVNSE